LLFFKDFFKKISQFVQNVSETTHMKIHEKSLCFYKDWISVTSIIGKLCRCLRKSVYVWHTRRLETLPNTVVINYVLKSTLDTSFITSFIIQSIVNNSGHPRTR